MSKFSQKVPTSIRKRHIKHFPPTILKPIEYDQNSDCISDIIYELQSDKPYMIARFSSVELGCGTYGFSLAAHVK